MVPNVNYGINELRFACAIFFSSPTSLFIKTLFLLILKPRFYYNLEILNRVKSDEFSGIKNFNVIFLLFLQYDKRKVKVGEVTKSPPHENVLGAFHL